MMENLIFSMLIDDSQKLEAAPYEEDNKNKIKKLIPRLRKFKLKLNELD